MIIGFVEACRSIAARTGGWTSARAVLIMHSSRSWRDNPVGPGDREEKTECEGAIGVSVA